MSDQKSLVKLAIDQFVQSVKSSREEKEATHKLAKEYGSLLENFNDVVFITDKEGYFVFVNKASEQRTGIPKEIFIGRHFLECGSLKSSSDFKVCPYLTNCCVITAPKL
jgi:PAS domain-containing protein